MGMRKHAVRLTVPVAALVTVLTVGAPAWASTVQIQDDAHVLNATVVQNDAATLPVGVYIWATTQDAASKSTFDTDVRNKVSSTFPIVVGINTQSRHETIQIGAQAGISQNAALAAESNANRAFVTTMHNSQDYTAAVTAALDNLRTSLAAAHRGRAPAQPVGRHSVGIGLLPIILVLGAIVAVIVLLRRRGRSGFGRPMPGPATGGPPPMGPYPDYGPSYGSPYRSGMGAGAAGAIGAVGGGLLGYELGKMQGEQQQFRQDEMMRDRERDAYDTADQGDWVVGQDSDFGGDAGGATDNSGSSGDW
ncbi:MAG TPA: hypothetical protein VFA63_18060 [Pseudonocardiaceae bacterium]|nr:hypothetical protein [Pseudonocardiaceae bacterium]